MVGAVAWLVGTLQFLVAMAVTQAGWTAGTYSLTQNYISDLGAVTCGTFGGSPVCSPWHAVFNTSIVILGLLLIVGVLLLRPYLPEGRDCGAGMILLVAGGIGAMGVGFSPEDVNLTIHSISAAIAFAGTNVALILLGSAWRRATGSRRYGLYSIASGGLGLIALALFGLGLYGPLGVGGMERLIVAPVLLWALVIPLWMLVGARRRTPGPERPSPPDRATAE